MYTRFASRTPPRACYRNEPDTYAHATRWHAWPSNLRFCFSDPCDRAAYEDEQSVQMPGQWRYSLLLTPAGTGWLVIDRWLAIHDEDDGDGETVEVSEIDSVHARAAQVPTQEQTITLDDAVAQVTGAQPQPNIDHIHITPPALASQAEQLSQDF